MSEQLLLIGTLRRPRRRRAPAPSAPPEPPRLDRGVLLTPEVEQLIRANAPVAVGISGGKDSQVTAILVHEHLNAVGHTGPRILIHSDLGRTEWRDTPGVCEALAARLGWELVTVRREAGDMMDRWLVRWTNNLRRYAGLSCVKLILPWSTSSMRFCTSEMKTAIICRELIRRYPGQIILSVTGIRRQESPKRKKALIAKAQAKLYSAHHCTWGCDWHPILDWRLDDVLAFLAASGCPLHPAYTVYGSTRLSCAFCILASAGDLLAASRCPENADLYREMVDLEVASSFSFHSDSWLGDVAPHLLADHVRAALVQAKERARRRELAEARIPEHLLYDKKGWPTCVPTAAEAELLCLVRREVAAAVGLQIGFTEPGELVQRYEALMAAKADRDAEDEDLDDAA